jgi:acetyl esterase/lipase
VTRAPAPRRSGAFALGVALLVTALLVLASAMVLVPPRSMGMLLLTVGITEYSPLLALADLVWLLVTWRLLRGHRTARLAAMTALLVAGGVALRPLWRFDRTAHAASAAIGPDAGVARYSPLDAFRTPALQGAVREQAIAYRAADGAPLRLRLYHGTLPGSRPTVVVIYGGAWRAGDPSQGAGVSRTLASSGYTVASIDYRHAPAARFPAQLDDVRRAIVLLRDSAAAWSIDTTRIALLGRSAGGHLAELAAWTPGMPAVQAVVAIYAPFDLVQGYRDLPAPDPIDVRAVLRDFLGGSPAEQGARYRDASPSTLVRAGLPPTLLLYGARDHVVKPEFNRGAAGRLRAAHVPVMQVEVPWAEHGFDMAPGGLGAQLAVQVITDFLDRALHVTR